MAALEVQTSAARVEGGAIGQCQAILDIEIVVAGSQIAADGDAVQSAVAVQRRGVVADDCSVFDRAVTKRGQATGLEQTCRTDVQRRGAQIQCAGDVETAGSATERSQRTQRVVARKVDHPTGLRDGARIGKPAGLDVQCSGSVGGDGAVVDQPAVAVVVTEIAGAQVRKAQAKGEGSISGCVVDESRPTRTLQRSRAARASHTHRLVPREVQRSRARVEGDPVGEGQAVLDNQRAGADGQIAANSHSFKSRRAKRQGPAADVQRAVLQRTVEGRSTRGIDREVQRSTDRADGVVDVDAGCVQRERADQCAGLDNGRTDSDVVGCGQCDVGCVEQRGQRARSDLAVDPWILAAGVQIGGGGDIATCAVDRGGVADSDIGRVQQQRAAAAAPRAQICRAEEVQHMLARSLARAAVAALLAAAGAQVAGEVRVVVSPDDHLAAIAVDPSIGGQHHACRHGGVLSVDDVRVLALQVAADQDGSAAGIAGYVDARSGLHVHLLAQHGHLSASPGRTLGDRHCRQRSGDTDDAGRRLNMDRASRSPFACVGRDDRRAADGDVAACRRDRDRSARLARAALGQDLGSRRYFHVLQRLQNHPTAFKRRRLRADDAAVSQRSGKDAYRVADECAQVDGFISRRLHLQTDTFEAAASDLHRLTRSQDDRAIARLHDGADANLYLRGKQNNVATARQHRTLNIQRPGETVGLKPQSCGDRIGIAHGQRGGGEAGSVHHGTGANGDARRVDQYQFAVGAQCAEDGTGVGADDAVDACAGSCGLDELGSAAGGHGKALPVDGRVVACRPVLGGDNHVGALLHDSSLAMDDLRSCELGIGNGGGQAGSNCQRKRQTLMDRDGWTRGAKDANGGQLSHGSGFLQGCRIRLWTLECGAGAFGRIPSRTAEIPATLSRAALRGHRSSQPGRPARRC